MEKRKLPNATAVLVLGICSFVGCCCYGIVGIILSVIALVLAAKDMKLYLESPELYINYSNLNIGRILAIIGLVISTIYFAFSVYMITVVGEEGMQSFLDNLKVKIEQQQENN